MYSPKFTQVCQPVILTLHVPFDQHLFKYHEDTLIKMTSREIHQSNTEAIIIQKHFFLSCFKWAQILTTPWRIREWTKCPFRSPLLRTSRLISFLSLNNMLKFSEFSNIPQDTLQIIQKYIHCMIFGIWFYHKCHWTISTH